MKTISLSGCLVHPPVFQLIVQAMARQTLSHFDLLDPNVAGNLPKTEYKLIGLHR